MVDISKAGAIVRALLYIPAVLYRLILKCREFLYRRGILKKTKVPVPVISIGNITMGGTGKTPTVEFVARYLSEKSKKVAILSRGYAAARTNKFVHATPNNNRESFINDEYLVLLENLPNIPNLLGKNRVKNAATAIGEYGAECLILDDGFQHWRLERDLDIVVIDALNPFGFERLIPQGTLREPLRNLRRAHIFVISHCDQCPQNSIDLIKQRLKQINDNAPIVETAHYPSLIESLYEHTILETSWLNGKIVYAFCGLGNPNSFKLTLKGLGARVSKFTCFPDHHFYTQSELGEIIREAESLGAEAIITTQKDGVKIKHTFFEKKVCQKTLRYGDGSYTLEDVKSRPLLVLKIEMKVISGKDALCGMLNLAPYNDTGAELLSGKKNSIQTN